jgi:hypothetical protein
MTEGRKPGSTPGTDHETTALPAPATPASEHSSSWGATTTTTTAGSPRPAETGPGIGSKITAAGSTAVGAAASAADTAKTALKQRADKSERKSRSVRKASKGARQPRRARLTLSHINVYSVFKFSCLLAIALFLVWLSVVGVLYGLLDVSGVFTKVNDAVNKINGDTAKSVVNGHLVFVAAVVIGAVNVVLFIALSTIGSMIYNLCADLVGGVEVTLSERE